MPVSHSLTRGPPPSHTSHADAPTRGRLETSDSHKRPQNPTHTHNTRQQPPRCTTHVAAARRPLSSHRRHPLRRMAQGAQGNPRHLCASHAAQRGTHGTLRHTAGGGREGGRRRNSVTRAAARTSPKPTHNLRPTPVPAQTVPQMSKPQISPEPSSKARRLYHLSLQLSPRLSLHPVLQCLLVPACYRGTLRRLVSRAARKRTQGTTRWPTGAGGVCRCPRAIGGLNA